MIKRSEKTTPKSPLNPAGFFNFKKHLLRKLFMKGVALALVFSFSYSQIVWAVDVRQMILDAKTAFDQDTRRSGSMTSTDLTTAQTQQQAVVTQQQALQDLQNTNFSLTTKNGDLLEYVGNTLSHVTRPDGTTLRNIQVDASGNILNADLKVSDGSIQIFQGGQVIGYGTPDGSTVIYSAGQIQKMVSKDGLVETLYTYNKDANGNLIETVLDNPSYTTKYDTNNKLKEVYGKSTGSRTTYSNGIIQKTVKSDGSQILYNSVIQPNGDILVTPAGGSSNTFTDAQGNIFTFSAGIVSQVKLTDGSIIDSIVWDANNKINSANLTQTDGSKYIYQNKQLTRFYDPAGTVTNYTYNATTITVSSGGTTWEYLSDKTLSKVTYLDGSYTIYYTSGPYKGLKYQDIPIGGGIPGCNGAASTYIYEYAQNVNGSISVQRQEVHLQAYNLSVLAGYSALLSANNPYLLFDARFENDNSFDPKISISATGTGKSLSVNLVPGTAGSSFTFNGVTTALNLTMTKGTTYTVEVRWETGRIGIYVYPKGTARPTSPQGSVTDRSWDVTFKVTAQNAYADYTYYSTNWLWSQRGGFGRSSSSYAQNYSYLTGSPAQKINFTLGGGYQDISLKVAQYSGSVSRNLSVYWSTAYNSWSSSLTDWSTNTTTRASAAQTLTAGVNYIAEMRVEGSKLNLYVYPQGQTRSATPLLSWSSLNGNTQFQTTFNGNFAKAEQYKNLTALVYTAASFQGKTLTSRIDTVKNLTITKPAAPATNPTDYLSITYGSDSKIKQIIKTDNSKYTFQNGLLSQVTDVLGNPVNFNFAVSDFSNITGSEIAQNGLNSTYDATGRLSTVKVNDLTIHYLSSSNQIDTIEKTDGTSLRNLMFDASGNVTGADITAPDGEVRNYQGGQLVNLRQPDNSRILYANNKPSQMITPEKLTYNFDYSAPGIVQAALDPSIVLTDTLTPVKMQYDTNFNLTKVIRKNNEVLNYLNNTLTQIDLPSTASQVFNYQKDAGGIVLSYTVTQGNVVTTYDANNNPTSAVINPTTDNPHTLNVSYQYGKIRQIKKDGVVTFNYTYSFDASNHEITEIDDLEENTHKKYRDGNLLTSLDKNTSVLSTYSYTNNAVSQVQVSRFGRNLHTYNYSYSADLTVVTDEENVTRSYDTNKRLLYLEKDSQKFKYSYTMTMVQGTPTTQQAVLPVTTFGTSSRTQGTQSWELWQQNTSEGCLAIGTSGYALSYAINLSQAGDLKIDFASMNIGGVVPAGYQFQLDFAVDGVSAKQFWAVAGSSWTNNTLTLTGLTQGAHTIQLKWLNDYYVPGQYDANFKFNALKMTYLYQVSQQVSQEIVTEDMIEKKLSDGSVAHYVNSKLTNITRPDGLTISDVVSDSSGQASKATVTLTNGAKQVFDSAGVLEEMNPDGSHFYFSNNKLSKTVDSAGNALLYSYGTNPDVVWVQRGLTALKYDLIGNLLGIKFDSLLDPQEVNAQTLSLYQDGSNGVYSTDGDFNTGQVGGLGSLYSERDFPSPQTITQLVYRIDASANSNGPTDNGSSAVTSIEIKDATTGLWTTVTGTQLSQSHNNSGGGGSTAFAPTANPATIQVNLSNVAGVRAVSGASAFANGGGNTGGYTVIYELQYTLADQSYLNFSSSGSGYTLQGYGTTVGYDLTGKLLSASNAAMTNEAKALEGKIQTLKTLPNSTKISVSSPADLNSWVSTAQSSVIDAQAVMTQEYSSDGTMQTQIKADGTVTLFDNNKPFKVLDSQGLVLIQYSYDVQGNPNRVYLKNARDTLPGEVLKAKQSIEDQRAATLLTLAKQKNLAYQSIKANADTQKALLQTQSSDLQTQYNSVAGTSASGSAARSARADALSQVQGAINQIISALTSISSSEADAYAALDAQVKTVSDQIEADSQSAFTALATQETNMKQEILRQEVSPVVYDTYRRLLGRDPSSTEYSSWIVKIDYASGADFTETKTTDGQLLTAALASAINSSPELADRQAYVATIKTNIKTQINSYLSMTDAQKQAFATALGLAAQDTIPLSSVDAQKVLTWLNSRSLHFGQSAFLALESLLDQKGITYTRTDLAQKCIMIDVLTGVISPLDDGDLVISMFALNKVAGLYGVSLSGANMTWDDLKNLYDANSAIIGTATQINTLPGSSITFDGSGDYLSVPSSDDWNLGAGDFTVETWVKLSELNKVQGIVGSGIFSASTLWSLYVDSSNRLSFHTGNWDSGSTYTETTSQLQANTWTHVAAVRSGGTFSLYINGQLAQGYSTAMSNFTAVSGTLTVGSTYNLATSPSVVAMGTGTLSVSVQAPTKINLQWTGGSTLAGFQILRSTDGINFTPIASAPNTSTQYVDTNVSLGYTYYYKVQYSVLSGKTQASYYSSVAQVSILSADFHGYVDDLRISKGNARYTANFTPATIRQTADSYTKLLMYSDPAQGIKDLSSTPHSITISGGTKADTSTYAQSIQQVVTYKVITRYPSIIADPTKLTAAQKQDIIDHPENYNPRIIAHINGNHYVVITGMTSESITYIDPGAGPDKNNQIETISKASFLKGWKGNVTAASALLNPVVTASAQKPVPTARLLNKDETQKIRGAFFFFLIPLFISFAASIGGAVASVIAGIGTILAGVGTLVAGALSSIGGFLATVAQGIGYIGSAIWQGISFAASSLFGALGNVGSFLSQNVFGSLAKAGFGNALFQNAVKIGLNIAVNKGLESLGVNSTISSLASAFVTGGITGGSVNAGLNASNFIAGGLKGLALEGSQTLLQKVGLDANLSSVLSLASGQFVNGILQGNLGGQIVKIAQSLATNLSFYGIQQLGQSLGIDSRISTLIGSPISGALGAGLQGGANVGTNIINAVKDGISRGITNLAIEYGGKALNLSPFFTGLTARAVTGALEGLLKTPANQIQGLFQGFFQGITQSGINALTFDQNGPVQGDVDLDLQRTLYLQRILKFSDVIKKDGLNKAIENHITDILQRDAVESVFKQGGIASLISGNSKPVLDANGNTVAIEVKVQDNVKIYLNPTSQNVVGRDYGNVKERGTYAIDPTTGKFGLLNGTISNDFDGGFAISYVQNGAIQKTYVVNDQGDFKFSLSARDPQVGLIINSYDWSVADGVVYDPNKGTVTTIKNNQVVKQEKFNPTQIFDPSKKFDVTSLPKTQTFFGDVTRLMGNSQLSDGLQTSMTAYAGNHGFQPGSRLVTETTTTFTTPTGIIEQTTETGLQYVPEGAVSLVGTEDSHFNVTLSGNIEVANLGNSSATFSVKAFGKTSYQGIDFQGGGFGEIEGSVQDISLAHGLQAKPGVDLRLGVHTEQTGQGQNLAFSSYLEGNAVVFESELTDKDGHLVTQKFKFTPQNTNSQSSQVPFIEHNMNMLHDLLTGQKSSLTPVELNDLKIFMKGSFTDLLQKQNLAVPTNLDTISEGFSQTLPNMLQNFARQAPDILIGALGKELQNIILVDPVRLGLTFTNELLKQSFPTGDN